MVKKLISEKKSILVPSQFQVFKNENLSQDFVKNDSLKVKISAMFWTAVSNAVAGLIDRQSKCKPLYFSE